MKTINLGRLRLSRCLTVFKDTQSPPYLSALALIQAGKDTLTRRLRIEARNRQAIIQGRKVHDRPPRART